MTTAEYEYDNPCPVCGGAVDICEPDIEERNWRQHHRYFYCDNCDWELEFEDEPDADEAWDSRE